MSIVVFIITRCSKLTVSLYYTQFWNESHNCLYQNTHFTMLYDNDDNDDDDGDDIDDNVTNIKIHLAKNNS